jgi:hypothetical protein
MSTRRESAKWTFAPLVFGGALDGVSAAAFDAGVSDKPLLPSDPRAQDLRAQDPRAKREAELAEALRANLKRRKAAPAAESNDAQRVVHEADERADPPLPPPTRDG